MADISKITLPSGSTYNLKDQQARDDIAAIEGAISGGVTFMGETTTPLTDGATTTSIVINSATITAIKGFLVVYNNKEFIFDGTKWIEMGDLSLIGDLGWKDSASGNFTPSGEVSQPTFSGDEITISGSFTPNGSVSAPTISIDTAGSTAVVNSITDVGTLPVLSTTVNNETLTIGFSQGTLPTKGSNTTVKTGDASYTASTPIFTGTAGNISAKGTPTGTVSKPSFTGTQGTVTVT